MADQASLKVLDFAETCVTHTTLYYTPYVSIRWYPAVDSLTSAHCTLQLEIEPYKIQALCKQQPIAGQSILEIAIGSCAQLWRRFFEFQREPRIPSPLTSTMSAPIGGLSQQPPARPQCH